MQKKTTMFSEAYLFEVSGSGKTTRSPEGYPSDIHHKYHVHIMSTMCPPPSYKLVNKSPSNYSYLRTINHSEIGVMFTNWTLSRGPHIVYICTICCLDFFWGLWTKSRYPTFLLDPAHHDNGIIGCEKKSSWNTKKKLHNDHRLMDLQIYINIYIYIVAKEWWWILMEHLQEPPVFTAKSLRLIRIFFPPQPSPGKNVWTKNVQNPPHWPPK